MEYVLIGFIAAVFFGSHYGFARWARKAMDPENQGFDIPFPLWLHFIIAIPAGLVTALVVFLLLKALT